MELSKGDEPREMYSPDNQGEYVPELGMHNSSIQGLSDALTSLKSKVTMVQPLAEEYALLLEVTMADCPGHPHLPTFSWNVGMVLHVLKGDPTLRDLEHVWVDGPGTVYLFFYDKQGCRGLMGDATQALQMHVVEVFSEWIFHSAHFVIIPLLLVEGWWQAMAASDRHCHRSRAEYPDHPVPHLISSESDFTPPLVGSTPPSAAWMGQAEETGGGHTPRVSTSQPRGRPPKTCPAKDSAGNSLPFSPERDGMDSDGYSTVSEAESTHHHRRRW